MTAASKFPSPLKLHCGGTFTSRTAHFYGEAVVVREETGKGTGESWRGTGPSAYTRIMEITSGTTNDQQGLVATCEDRLSSM